MVGGALSKFQDILASYSGDFALISIMFYWFTIVFVIVRSALFAVRLPISLCGRRDAPHPTETADTAISLLAGTLFWAPAEFAGNLIFQVGMGVDERDMEGCAKLGTLDEFADCAQTMALVVILQSLITILCGVPMAAALIFYLARHRPVPLSPIYVMIALTMLLQSIWTMGVIARARM